MKYSKLIVFCFLFVISSSFVFGDANDVCSGAATLNIGSSYLGYINPLGDIDWGKWYVPSAGTLTITLDVPAGRDYDLSVFDSCPPNTGCGSYKSTGADEECVIEVQQGWYYSKVHGAYNHYSSTAKYYIEGSFEPAAADYDLYVKSITPPSTINENEGFYIDFIVRNSGTDDAGSYRTNVYVDNSFKNGITVSGVNGGSEMDYRQYISGLSAGNHTIKIVTDVNNDIDETDEGNNEKTKTIYVNEAPKNYDLEVDQLIPSIQFPTAGEPFDIDYRVINRGSDTYTGSFTTELYIDNVLESTTPRSYISAGGTESFTKRDVVLTEGRHLVKVVTDTEDEVDETDEWDNEKNLYIDVLPAATPKSDLIVSEISPSIQFPTAGEAFDIDYKVKNIGNADYPGSFTTQLFIDDVLKATTPRSTITAGGTQAYTKRDVVLTEGRHLVKVVTDTGEEADEADESNNIGTLYIDVLAPVDPCAGVNCSDYCDGTTLFTSPGCSNGNCNYQQIQDSTQCGYTDPTDPCDGVTCDDYCDGTISYTNGVCGGNGLCYYDVDLFSPDCGYVPPGYSGIVVLDPGHTLANDEGTLNHRISAALKTLLEADGFEVYETPSNLNVNQRADFADNLGADILLSIHFNAFDSTVEGSEAFYYDSDDNVLCQAVLPHVVGILPSNDRGVKPDTASAPGSLGILRSRDGPACLVEMEFLDRVRQVTFDGVTYSNFRDLLYSDDYLAASTQALQEGIRDYFDGVVPDPVDPCDGVTCDDKCVGTTSYFDGYCVDGDCEYAGIEPMSTTCGYDPCAFMLCEDYCYYTTLYTSAGCSNGNCNYQAIPNSPECTGPCGGVDTSDYCSGDTHYFNGVCVNGVVLYESEECEFGCSGDSCAEDPCLTLSSNKLALSSNQLTLSPDQCTPDDPPGTADIVIEEFYFEPSVLGCSGANEVFATLVLSNQNDVSTGDIVLDFWSEGLKNGFSYLIDPIVGNGHRTEINSLVFGSGHDYGTYDVDVDVLYEGGETSGTAQLKMPYCTDYFVDNIDEIPDIYQEDDYLNLNGGGTYHCGPSSASNIVVWLYENGFTNLSTGTQSEALKNVVNNLSQSEYMDTEGVGATDPVNLVSGLDKYLTDRGYNVTAMEFQGWKNVADKYDTNVTVPELDWIKEGTRDYSGVLLHLGWYNHYSATDRYRRNGGHWVTVVGYGKDSEGNTNPNFLIIHDPNTDDDEENEYINMTNITSGTFVHTHATIPNSAVGFYIMDGVQTNTIPILEGAVRFNVEEIETEGTDGGGTGDTGSSGSSGGSGNGGSSGYGGTSSGSTGYVTGSTATAPATPPAPTPTNPALATLRGADQGDGTAALNTQVERQVASAVPEPVSEEMQIVVESVVTVRPVEKIVLDCNSDSDCGTGNVCLPSGFFSRLFSDTKCCPAGSELIDGRCEPPETKALWNEECSDDIPCEEGLECISTAHWYSLFNWDKGVCCSPGTPLENDKCTLQFNPEVPEDKPWPFKVNAMIADVEDDVGRTDYARDVRKENDYVETFQAGSYKCNLYVNNKLNEAGLPAPNNVPGTNTALRAEGWADPNEDIDHWEVVDDPQPGDVVACRADNVNPEYSGHVGIVVEVTETGGYSVSAGTYAVNRNTFGFDGECDYTFRRYTE
jgi:hypothetical protein